MDNPTPLKKVVTTLGGHAATAKLLNVSAGLVWQWLNGRRPLPPKYCPLLERASVEAHDATTCEELLPDIEWKREAGGGVIGYLVPVQQAEEEVDPDADRVQPPEEVA